MKINEYQMKAENHDENVRPLGMCHLAKLNDMAYQWVE